MTIPTIAELMNTWHDFKHAEGVSWRIVAQPSRFIDLLLRHRFLHFLVIGGGGAMLGLGLTWLLTTYVYGLDDYFTAYLIGTGCALLFNFTMYSLVIFRTSQAHVRRLAVYFTYIVSVIALQASLVRTITPIVGVRWYLVVIATVIGLFSLTNFLVFKLSIFRERHMP